MFYKERREREDLKEEEGGKRKKAEEEGEAGKERRFSVFKKGKEARWENMKVGGHRGFEEMMLMGWVVNGADIRWECVARREVFISLILLLGDSLRGFGGFLELCDYRFQPKVLDKFQPFSSFIGTELPDSVGRVIL